MPSPQQDIQEYPDTLLSAQSFLFIILAMSVGTLMAVIMLPGWLPQMAASLFGPDPKVYWYLSRSSAFVALSLLWTSMALGILMSNKIARSWPGIPVAFAIHEFISLLGVGFSLFHALVLLGDRYINYDFVQMAFPFASSYEPVWVGLGQLGFYAMLIVTISFYVRQKIGQKTWRILHYISFLTYVMALLHGITSGSDTSLPWAQQYYWISGGSLLFLLMYRIVISLSTKKSPAPARVANA